ncbi:MAG: outer membrane beta-barrel protein [Bacteroidaceae bacterium]|nr:outer membrane beta-barrel protein [Bacteroidaceae bacterium]
MKKRLLFLFMIFAAIAVCAQEGKKKKTGTLTGVVYSKAENQPLQNATLQLYQLPDTVYKTGSPSDQEGKFLLQAPEGEYLLRLTYVGFVPQDKIVNIKAKKSTDVGRLVLNDDVAVLAEAVVTEVAPPITMSEDTTVYNTSAFRVAPGSMLEELIKKYPGVQVEEDGTIKINGKTVSRILMKGKDFFGTDKQVALKNVPVDLVDKVKFYDKQSDFTRVTGIDDGEEETVLDLQMKKGADEGFFGNIDAAYGTKERYSFKNMSNLFSSTTQMSLVLSANNVNDRGFSGRGGSGLSAHKEGAFNFATEGEKYEFGGNVRYRHNDTDNQSFTASEYFMTEGRSNQFSNSRSRSFGRNSNINGNFRIEWKPDTLTNIIFLPSFSWRSSDGWSKSTSATFSADPFTLMEYPMDRFGDVYDALDSIAINSNNNESMNNSKNRSVNAMLQFNRRLGKPGRNITLQGRFNYSDSESKSISSNDVRYYQQSAGSRGYDRRRYSTTPGTDWSYNARLSYTEPILKNLFVQLSYRFNYSYSNSDRATYVFDSIPTDIYHLILNSNYEFPSLPQDYEQYRDNDLSRLSIYRNVRHDAQIMFRYVTEKINLNAGVTWMPQSTQMRYQYLGLDTVLKRTIYNITPNLRMRYRWNKTTTLNVMYRGSTNQPSMTDLLDITDDSNPLYITKGNPGLKPSFNSRLSAFFTTNNPETQTGIAANLSFNNTLNSITRRVTYIEETGGQISQPVNINGNWGASGGFNFNSALPKNKKFTYSTGTSLGYNHQVSYISPDRNSSSVRNTVETVNVGERLKFGYRNDVFELTMDGSLNYSHSNNEQQPDRNLDTWNFSYGPSGNIKFPWHNLTLSSNLSMSSRRGYDDPQFNTNELLWNAQLSAGFLANNALTVSLQLYDILQEQSNISRTINAIMRSDTQNNSIFHYALVHVIYKINSMGDRETRRTIRGMGPGGFGGPGFGRGGGFGGGRGY